MIISEVTCERWRPFARGGRVLRTVASAQSQLSFGESIWDLLNRADIRRADSAAERDAIFRLRYQAYIEEKAVQPNRDHRLTDPYDDSRNAWIFGIYIDGELASSIRLHVATCNCPDMPSLDVFGDHLRPMLDSGAVVIDPTRHVVVRRVQQRYPYLVYLTMRLGLISGEYFGAGFILAAVRTEHQGFYRRIFGHQVVAPARKYPLLEKPISLMVLDFRSARERVYGRYSFFRSTHVERRALFERTMEAPPLTPQAEQIAEGAL
jgi:N-acyl-L-homoserine lactone synthetase